MLATPKNRICPSLSCSSWVNMRRQPDGEANGNRPSITSTSPSAIQNTSLPTAYFLPPAAPPLRMTLKNSLEEGSRTMTSLLLAKLAL